MNRSQIRALFACVASVSIPTLIGAGCGDECIADCEALADDDDDDMSSDDDDDSEACEALPLELANHDDCSNASFVGPLDGTSLTVAALIDPQPCSYEINTISLQLDPRDIGGRTCSHEGRLEYYIFEAEPPLPSSPVLLASGDFEPVTDSPEFTIVTEDLEVPLRVEADATVVVAFSTTREDGVPGPCFHVCAKTRASNDDFVSNQASPPFAWSQAILGPQEFNVHAGIVGMQLTSR